MQVAGVDRQLVIRLTQELIRFRSVNPPGNELPAAEFLADRMREVGIEAHVQAIAPDRANVVGRIPGRGGPALAFTGHLDVVPPGGQAWEHDPFAGELVDDRIYGRGSADMKGGVAAIVTAGAALVQAGFQPSGDILMAFTAGEEAGGAGAHAMVAARSLEGAAGLIVAEPTDLNVLIGERGINWFRIRALGRTAHGSMPHLGSNAVSFMARLIPRLEAHQFPYRESSLLGGPSLSVNVITGGNKTNVVPDVCEIEVDMRTVPGQDHQQILQEVAALAAETAREFDPTIRTEVEPINDKVAIETERSEPLVQALIQAVVDVCGRQPVVDGVPFGTDGAILGPGFTMPVVICGPGASGMAHQPDEWVPVEQLVQAAEIYVAACRRLLG